MKEINFQLPFLTDHVNFTNSETIKAGERKFTIIKDCFSEPAANKNYFVFGKIKVKLIDSIKMEWEKLWEIKRRLYSIANKLAQKTKTKYITPKLC